MQIRQVTKNSQYWHAFIEHIKNVSDIIWYVDESGDLIENLHCLIAVVDDMLVGHISFRVQPITVPSIGWSEDDSFPLTSINKDVLRETFVNYFEVKKEFRRQGIGTALQKEGLRLTGELGCIQMRSWSSLSKEADNGANYALKLKLGFAVHPVTSQAMNGTVTRGVYFSKSTFNE